MTDQKPTVLVVDDDEATCVLVKAILRSRYDVDVAVDGQEAIDRLATRQYAAILIDLAMPVLDGFAVLDYIEAQRPDHLARVLVVTASLESERLSRVYAYGISGVVSKPFEVEMLLVRVDRCVQGGRAGTTTRILAAGPMILYIVGELLGR